MEKNRLTSANGRPVADNQNSQTAGQRGPILMQDPWLIEKLAHFDREVIPERRMHAKGAGAYGTFTVTHDISAYTRASIFSEVGKKTECFVRFSTVAGERGAADAERDIRGFAMKFYKAPRPQNTVCSLLVFHRDSRLSMTKIRTNVNITNGANWRKRRDSNPQWTHAHHQFSRLAP